MPLEIQLSRQGRFQRNRFAIRIAAVVISQSAHKGCRAPANLPTDFIDRNESVFRCVKRRSFRLFTEILDGESANRIGELRNKDRRFFRQGHSDPFKGNRKFICTGLESNYEASPAEALQVARSLSPGLILGRRFSPHNSTSSRTGAIMYCLMFSPKNSTPLIPRDR